MKEPVDHISNALSNLLDKTRAATSYHILGYSSPSSFDPNHMIRLMDDLTEALKAFDAWAAEADEVLRRGSKGEPRSADGGSRSEAYGADAARERPHAE